MTVVLDRHILKSFQTCDHVFKQTKVFNTWQFLQHQASTSKEGKYQSLILTTHSEEKISALSFFSLARTLHCLYYLLSNKLASKHTLSMITVSNNAQGSRKDVKIATHLFLLQCILDYQNRLNSI